MTNVDGAAGSPRRVFGRAQRLTHAREYQAAFAARMRKSCGPLAVFLNPTPLASHRLGLSIGRAVGGAVVRNRLKRMLRESFRLNRDRIPSPPGGSYDIVVSARPHAPLPLEGYTAILLDLTAQAHRDLARRRDRQAPGDGHVR